MTSPTDGQRPEMREALARALARVDGWGEPDARWTDNLSLIASGQPGPPVWTDYLEDADALLAVDPLAALIAECDRLRMELDAARALNRDLHRRVQKAERFRARWGDSVKGVLIRLYEERQRHRNTKAILAAMQTVRAE